MPVRSASFSPRRPVSPGRSKYSVEQSLDDLMNEWTRIARISGEPPSGASLAQVLRSLRDGTISPRIVIEQLASSDAAQYLVVRARTLGGFAMTYFVWLILLFVVIACLCYLFLGDNTYYPREASASYLWLFVARQFVGLATAMIPQSLVIASILALEQLSLLAPPPRSPSPPILLLVGFFLNLLIIESNEWPLIVFWWAIFDMSLLSGSHPFIHHWLFFQDTLPIFNHFNASGNLVGNELYYAVLRCALSWGPVVSIARLAVRLHREEQVYQLEGRKLIKVMRSMIAILELTEFTKATKKNDVFTNSYRVKLDKLLEQVETSSLSDEQAHGASFHALRLFRKASAFVNQELHLKPAGDIYDGNAKRKISKKAFVQTIDAAYKAYEDYRKATIRAPQAEHAFQAMVDTIFYISIIIVTLWQLGFDLKTLFASFGAIMTAFLFVIGTASSMGFGGLIFILIRDPYRIGDWVEVFPSGSEPSGGFNNTITWRVEKIYLFHTEFVNPFTNAQFEKGNRELVANFQIVNWSRRPETFKIILQVPVDTYGELLLFQKFRDQAKQFADDNPHEWFAVNRVTGVDPCVAGSKYREYCIVIQHRESWQELELVLASKDKLTSYFRKQVVDDLHTAFSRKDLNIVVL